MPNFIPLFLLTYISTMPVQLKRSFHSSTYGTTLDGSSWLRDKENVFFLKSVVIKMSFFYQGHVYARVCLHQAMTHVHLFMWTVYVRVFMTKKSPKLCRDCLLAVCMSLSVNRKQSVWRDFPFQTPWKMQQKRVYCHLCLTLISIFMSDTSQLHNDSFFYYGLGRDWTGGNDSRLQNNWLKSTKWWGGVAA